MSATAARLGARVLRSPHFQEPGRVYRQSPGFRNQYGEFEPGGFTRADVLLVTWPTTGATRDILPAGLREKELRSFAIIEPVAAVSDAIEGDAIWWNNRFYRLERVLNWSGFREVVATYPFVGTITEDQTFGAFDGGFDEGFDI